MQDRRSSRTSARRCSWKACFSGSKGSTTTPGADAYSSPVSRLRQPSVRPRVKTKRSEVMTARRRPSMAVCRDARASVLFAKPCGSIVGRKDHKPCHRFPRFLAGRYGCSPSRAIGASAARYIHYQLSQRTDRSRNGFVRQGGSGSGEGSAFVQANPRARRATPKYRAKHESKVAIQVIRSMGYFGDHRGPIYQRRTDRLPPCARRLHPAGFRRDFL